MPFAADMPRPTRLFLLFCACLLAGSGALAPPAFAQEEEQDDPSALPDIAPREIEIRGTLEISLPSLERQPLSGFNPPPRIPDIAPDRSPHVGDYEQGQDGLPMQSPELPGLQARLDRPASPLYGELEAGGGRYFTRFANGQVWLPLSTREMLTIGGDYRGSSGFEPFTDAPDVETPFDTFDGQIGLQSRRAGFSLNADVEGFYDTYTLYGAEVNTQHPLAPDLALQPDRRSGHLQGTLGIETHGPVSLRLRGRASGTGYETTVFSETSNNDSLTAERRIQADGALAVPVGTAQATFDAAFETAGRHPEGRFDNDVTAFDGGLGAELFGGSALRLSVGGRFLLASIAPDARPDLTERRSARFLVPSFSLNWTASPSATLFVRNAPGVETHPLADLFGENPYLFGDVTVQPSLRTTDAEGGVRVFTGPFQMIARGGYRYVAGYQYFENTESASSLPSTALFYDAGVFEPHYASARIVHAGAEVSLQRMQGIEVSLGATYRNGELVNDETSIPYFAPVIGRAVLSYAFANQRGLIQLTGRFESARYVDRTESAQVDPYFDVDLEASFDVTPSLGLVVELQNVTSGSLERWPQYPHPPLVLTSGLRVQW